MVVQTVDFDLRKLIDLLMSDQISHGSLESVNLGGKNVGAATIVRRGSSGRSLNCCNITIYINNNVQGVSNSILVSSAVKMGDPRVCLSLSDLVLGKAFLGTNKKRRGFGMFLFVVVSILLLLWLF